MKSTSIISATFALLTCAGTIQLVQRTRPPAVVRFDVERKPCHDVKSGRLVSRGTVMQSLDPSPYEYIANISVGTPPQVVSLAMSVNSADTWVNTNTSHLCATGSTECTAYGTYYANSSSTYSYISSEFSITYAYGTKAHGDYVSDTMHIGGMDLKNQQFGIGHVSNSIGVLALGFPIQEAQVTSHGRQPYANVPQLMVIQGLINSDAFSLWLNDVHSSTSSILFGGVDTDKYSGTLGTVPMLPRPGNASDILVNLTDISIGDTALASDQNITVALDIGTTFTLLPSNITDQIFKIVNATYNDTRGFSVIDCGVADSNLTVDFTFSLPKISVSMRELVLGGTGLVKPPLCVFGIVPQTTGGEAILGDTFLRSAYVVYDLSYNEISLAQTRFNVSTSNVLEIANNINGVPGAVRGNAVTSSSISSTASSISTPTSSASTPVSHSSSISAGAGAGIGVGCFVVLLLLVISAFFLIRRRKHAAAPTSQEDAEYRKSELPAESAWNEADGAGIEKASHHHLAEVDGQHHLVEVEGDAAKPQELPGSAPKVHEMPAA